MLERAQSASATVGKKLAVLALAIIAIGLPINALFDYAILAVAAVIIFIGRVEALPSRWLAAVLLAAAVAAGHALLPPPQIEEGHNVFLPGPDAATTSGLPAPVLQYLDRQFAEQYPPEKRCNDPSRGCWRPDRTAAQDGFALSSDALFGRGASSRRVTGIDFSDPVHARIGVVNELIYNWSPHAGDIQRFD